MIVPSASPMPPLDVNVADNAPQTFCETESISCSIRDAPLVVCELTWYRAIDQLMGWGCQTVHKSPFAGVIYPFIIRFCALPSGQLQV